MRSLQLSSSPRARAAMAGGLVLGLAVLAPLGGLTVTSVVRWLLGATVLVSLGVWLLHRSQAGSRPVPPERLRVLSRSSLSPRCGLALVEVDGRCFLVAFGDSFAEIRRTHEPARASGRSGSPVSPRRTAVLLPRKGDAP